MWVYPKPRNFSAGLFKIKSTPGTSLPTDDPVTARAMYLPALGPSAIAIMLVLCAAAGAGEDSRDYTTVAGLLNIGSIFLVLIYYGRMLVKEELPV